MSKDDLFEVDDEKLRNLIEANREKEFAKIDAYDEKQDNNESRQNKKFKKSHRNFDNHRSGRGA